MIGTGLLKLVGLDCDAQVATLACTRRGKDRLVDERQGISTLVVSRPGVMQQALRTSLAACLPPVVLSSAGDGLTALNQVMAQHPALVVIDANLLLEESEALLVAIKAASAPPRCLVLVISSQHEARMMAAGADAVILRDVPAGELQSVVARLTEG